MQIHIPFYKKPNPFVGLEKFVSWENCGIIRGKMINEKDYLKLKPEEQATCYEFLVPTINEKDDGKRYAQPKDTARTLVCRHLNGEVPLSELYTPKIFTEEVLREMDDKIIKRTFQLPSIESLEDLAEVTAELESNEIENYEMADTSGSNSYNEPNEMPNEMG